MISHGTIYRAVYEESTNMFILDDVRLTTIDYKARYLLFVSTKRYGSTLRQMTRISTPDENHPNISLGRRHFHANIKSGQSTGEQSQVPNGIGIQDSQRYCERFPFDRRGTLQAQEPRGHHCRSAASNPHHACQKQLA